MEKSLLKYTRSIFSGYSKWTKYVSPVSVFSFNLSLNLSAALILYTFHSLTCSSVSWLGTAAKELTSEH